MRRRGRCRSDVRLAEAALGIEHGEPLRGKDGSEQHFALREFEFEHLLRRDALQPLVRIARHTVGEILQARGEFHGIRFGIERGLLDGLRAVEHRAQV